MEDKPRVFPEIPSGAESSIIRDVIEASSQEVVPSEGEWEMLRRPLLGKDGYGEDLFRKFEKEAIDFSYGLKTVAIKVFPLSDMHKNDYRVGLQSQEGNAIAFNDVLAGIEINLLYHERRGVLTFILTDRAGEGEGCNEEQAQRPDTFTSSSLRLMFKDPSTRIIGGSASLYSQGETFNYGFVPTSAAQLILLSIVDSILKSPQA